MNIRKVTHQFRRMCVVGGAVVASLALAAGSASAAGTVTGDKTLGTDSISCGGTVPVTVTLDAQAEIIENPVDVMLVLDRSGSMGGSPLSAMKNGANKFVDIIDEGSDGTLDGVIDGSRIGMVSFASGATPDQALTSDANAVKAAINSLVANGATAIGDGINLAQSQYSGGDNKMVVFTDGQNNTGANPSTAAANAKAAGTEIWAIGLGSVNAAQINDIASDPDSAHAFITPSESELEGIFEGIGADIVVPAATDVELVDTVDSNFSIANVSASKGTASVSGNQITWTIGELVTETVTLNFDAVHDPNGLGGTLEVNPTVTYTDTEGNTVDFPNPVVDVSGCAPVVSCEPTVNPSGKNVPAANNTNQDGFYVLGGSDPQTGDAVEIWLADNGSSAVFGPFDPGTKIKLVQDPDGEPSIRDMNGGVDHMIKIKGDAVVTATDSAGNVSDPATCLVPPKPQ